MNRWKNEKNNNDIGRGEVGKKIAKIEMRYKKLQNRTTHLLLDLTVYSSDLCHHTKVVTDAPVEKEVTALFS